MQDDVILCDDFVAKAERRALEAGERGFRAISLYNTHGAIVVRRVDDRWSRALLGPPSGRLVSTDKRHSIFSAIPGELCVVVRRDLAAEYSAWLRENSEFVAGFPNVHDAVFGVFLNATLGGKLAAHDVGENLIHIAIPNLVNHRNDVRSSKGGWHRLGSTTFRPTAD